MAQSGRRKRSIDVAPQLTSQAAGERNEIILVLIAHAEAHNELAQRAHVRKDYAIAAQHTVKAQALLDMVPIIRARGL